jgi:hypothetical protein
VRSIELQRCIEQLLVGRKDGHIYPTFDYEETDRTALRNRFPEKYRIKKNYRLILLFSADWGKIDDYNFIGETSQSSLRATYRYHFGRIGSDMCKI